MSEFEYAVYQGMFRLSLFLGAALIIHSVL